MADRRATNKYYPPEWEPKHGSINKFVGQHPLRQRAAKIGQGIMVVRFEMPYHTFCTTCNSSIPIGVRFNAEKSTVGKYHSTPILNFKMKCPTCPAIIEMQTDPQNRDYVCVTGLKRRELDWDHTADNAFEPIMDASKREAIQADPFRRLEHRGEDQQVAEDRYDDLNFLSQRSSVFYKDDFAQSQALRSKMREKKKELVELKNESKALGLRESFLFPKSEDDKMNSIMLLQGKPPMINAKKERLKIKTGSIFASEASKAEPLQKCIKQGLNPKLLVDSQNKKSRPNLLIKAAAEAKRQDYGIGTPKKSLAVSFKPETRRQTL